jgi:hypothetical protein
MSALCAFFTASPLEPNLMMGSAMSVTPFKANNRNI